MNKQIYSLVFFALSLASAQGALASAVTGSFECVSQTQSGTAVAQVNATSGDLSFFAQLSSRGKALAGTATLDTTQSTTYKAVYTQVKGADGRTPSVISAVELLSNEANLLESVIVFIPGSKPVTYSDCQASN